MAAKDDTSGVRVFPPAIYLAAVLIGFLLQRVVPLQAPASWRPFEHGAGIVLIVVGFVTNVSAIAVFRLSGTTPNPMKPVRAFVVRGPYRFTRNPMYLGLTVLCSGIGLTTDALWVTVLAFVAAVVTKRIVIDKEEPYLTRQFGSEYQAYTERVRRWL
jgi:protein-S-isoprenylcysteine O-methyltransferase Ste14